MPTMPTPMTRAQAAEMFRRIRLDKGWTHKQMADYLASQGVPIKHRSGANNIEKRGSEKYNVIRAYLSLQEEAQTEPTPSP